MHRWLLLILLCFPFGLAAAAIDLNAADQPALEALDGIGPTRARAIIEYRQTHGPFLTLEQVLEVKGIGPKTLERMRPHVVIRPAGHAPRASEKRRPAIRSVPLSE